MIDIDPCGIALEVPGTDGDLGPVFKDEKWLAYRKKWGENPKKDIVEKLPLQIDLFAVNICNLGCPMCPRRSYIPSSGYMDVRVVKKVLNEIAKGGLYAFNFGGLGEPTLYPDLFEVIRYAKKYGVVDVNIHTNGTKLNAGFNRQLIDSGLDRLIVSLDSADKEVYEKIRVGANFEQVYAGVEDLIEQRDLLGKNRPHVKVNFINMDEDDPTQKNRFVSYWKNKANRIAILRYLDCKNGEEKIYHRKNYIQAQNFCCPELWRRMTILSDGTATLCTRDMKKSYIIGNIQNQTISEIWLGEKMRHARDLHRQGRFKDIDLCADCPDSYRLKEET